MPRRCPELLLASTQRRRPIAGMHRRDFEDFGDEVPALIELGRAVAIAKSGAYGPRASDALLVLWSMAPYFRKSAAKKRSRNSHLVPLVGWGAAAARRVYGSSGILTPPASYVSKQSARKVACVQETLIFSAVMKHYFQGDGGNPYSPLLCVLTLLMVGIFVKLGTATQVFHLAQN